jgi:hypothetical protein
MPACAQHKPACFRLTLSGSLPERLFRAPRELIDISRA